MVARVADAGSRPMTRGRDRRAVACAVGLGLVTLVACRPSGRAERDAVPPPVIVTPSGVDMVLLPGGTFRMGAAGGAPDEAPVHEVTISPLAMDRHEVTQDQLAMLAIPNPSRFKGERRPVEMMRWSDAAEFCNARSEKDGFVPCYDLDTFACNFDASGYRLPTEAEWEYASRAGATRDGDIGVPGGAAKMPAYAWFAENAGQATHPVGARKPNRWGLHGLYGNVSEWCQDVYAETTYARGAVRDPRGPAAGKHRILRGGHFAATREDCRPTRRLHDTPGITDACFAKNTYGFRCVRRLSAEEAERVKRWSGGETADK